MSEKTANQPQDKYVLRLPDGMRERLKEIAAKNGRSLNSEIVTRLSETLENDELMERPVLTTGEVTERYESRLGVIEGLVTEIKGHLEKLNSGDADKRELEGSIAKRRSKKRED